LWETTVRPARKLLDGGSQSRFRATGQDAGQANSAESERPERRADADPAAADTVPLRLSRSSIGSSGYPPSAVATLLVAESLVLFAIGHMTELLSGVGGTGGGFGPPSLVTVIAAILFPIASIVQRSFASRAESVVALWGIRLIAPLAVAELVALALFAAVFSKVSLAGNDATFLHWIGSWFIAAYLANGLLNSGFETLIRHWEMRGNLARHVVVFGGSLHGQRFIQALLQQRSDVRVGAFFDDRAMAVPAHIAGIPYSGSAEELCAHVQQEKIDEIFIALPWSADNRILELLRKFRHLPVPVRLAPAPILVRSDLLNIGENALAFAPTIRERPLSEWGLFIKGLADRVIAAVALILILPILAAIAIAIRRDGGGPVIYRQQRLGFNNRPFCLYKFRTMRVSVSQAGELKQAKSSDPRLTPIGGLLRRWSLDELPQLYNVLRGDMSLVGPRPHPMWRQAADLWDHGGAQPLEAIIHEYASRHRVKPGLTGLAQVSGYRGETATVERMRGRVDLDVYYIDHWSIWFDLKILLLTLVTLFRGDNAY
jgi:Undecaprenyl-phosphate glucose phosphotransferase